MMCDIDSHNSACVECRKCGKHHLSGTNHECVKIISIDGIDGTYKSSIFRELYELLAKKFDVGFMKFPDRYSIYGKELEEIKNTPSVFANSVNLSLLFEMNRLCALTKIDYSKDVYVFDRYYPSGLVYALYRKEDISIITKYFLPVYPKSDIFIIDMDPHKAYKNLLRKNETVTEDYIAHLRQLRLLFLKLADEYRWNVIDANNETSTSIAKTIYDMECDKICA